MTADGSPDETLTVLPGEESVRRRPLMYFGADRGDSRLPAMVLGAIVREAFHPGADGAPAHLPRVVVEISGDRVFSVTDDQAAAPDMTWFLRHRLRAGRMDQSFYLLASALCTRVDLEVWAGRRGFRQTLDGWHPAGPAEPFEAPDGAGTRATFVLNEVHTGRAVLTADFDLHDSNCAERSGSVLVRDLRNGTEHRLS